MAEPLFFFGAMSPYSWFAAERIGVLMPDARWRPVFAGALFKASERVSWGLTERRGEGMADCEARAAAHGLGPIRWPDPWPTNALLIAPALTHADARGTLQPLALGAMIRLVDLLERWAAATGEEVVVVFERPPSPPIRSTVIEVAHAPRPQRDSADDEIVRRLRADGEPQTVRVVTSDLWLADRVHA